MLLLKDRLCHVPIKPYPPCLFPTHLSINQSVPQSFRMDNDVSPSTRSSYRLGFWRGNPCQDKASYQDGVGPSSSHHPSRGQPPGRPLTPHCDLVGRPCRQRRHTAVAEIR